MSLSVTRNGIRLFPTFFRNQMFRFSSAGGKKDDCKGSDKGVSKKDEKPCDKKEEQGCDKKEEKKGCDKSCDKKEGKKKEEPPCHDKKEESPREPVDEGEEVKIQCLSGGKGLIELNRPKQLNTLNTSMVSKIRAILTEWKEDKYFIFLKGIGGKAFCAGGDVVAITKDQSGQTGKKFFCEEYKLDAMISSLSVPFASLISGIVMGGGVGISLFGRYRIATETSMFAMPETQIGFFPDVGVSYHLARMPNKLGNFLALTGYRLKGYDLVHAGIATHYCLTADISALQDALLCDFQKSCCSCPEEILKEFQEKALAASKGCPPPFSLAEQTEAICKWFTADCLEEAMGKICEDKSPFATETMECIKKTSPLSLKVTFKQINQAMNQEIFDCFNTDYRIAMRMLTDSDFKEGVRAMLIDKDKKPKWKHEEISKVTAAEVDAFFCRLKDDDELNLPDSMCKPCF